MRRSLVGLVLASVASCTPAPAIDLPPLTVAHPAPLPRPDAAMLASLVTQMDPACGDRCCLPKIEWTSNRGPQISHDDAAAARGVLETAANPPVIALALRIVGRARDEHDIPLLARYLDDKRPAGILPNEWLTFDPEECYASHVLQPTSASWEAMNAIHEMWGIFFDSKRDYRAWLAAHPDPGSTFEVLLARAARKPQSPDFIPDLRAKSPLLAVQVLLTCQWEGFSCGEGDDATAALLKATVPRARYLAWLTGFKRPAEWDPSALWSVSALENLLRYADRVLDPADVPALEKLMADGAYGTTIFRARLGVLLAHLAPADADRYLETALGGDRGEMGVLQDEAVWPVLREAAKIDPVHFEKYLAEWFIADTDVTILQGLAEADPRASAPVFARLVRGATLRDSARLVRSLRAAADHFGCEGLPRGDAIVAENTRAMSKAQVAAEDARAHALRDSIAAKAKACAMTLPK